MSRKARAAPRSKIASPRKPDRPPVPPAPRPPYRVGLACGLGLLCCLIYLSSFRRPAAYDSLPARLLPFSILRQGNLDLDEFAWLSRLNPEPYFLRRGANGHWLSRYPVGIPVLMSPLYFPVTWWLQRQHIGDDDVRFRLAALAMERVCAALLAAASVGLVFLAATALTSVPGAAAVALVYGLGTSTWAISSQALWQHGPAELGVAGLTLCLVASGGRRWAVAAGGFAALAVLARPTMLIFALLALVFVWRDRRTQLLWFLSLPLLGAAMLLLYNIRQVNLLSGGDQYGRFALPGLVPLAGLLFSPNRGLFVYMPILALALPTLVHPQRAGIRWLSYAAIGVAAYLLLYSAWRGWWGGHSYGPRFLTDVLPVVALCAIPTAQRLWRRSYGQVLVVALAAYGVVVQGLGAYCDDNLWNSLPNIDHTPSRLWDWRDPQILSAARDGWHGFDLFPLTWQSLMQPVPARLSLMRESDLAGRITTDDPFPRRYKAGRKGTFDLRVTNLSSTAWPAFSDYGFMQVWIMYRWWLNGAVVSGQGGFIDLPWNLRAHGSIAFQAAIEPPQHPGSYELEFLAAQALDVEKGGTGNAVLRVPAVVE